LLGRQLVGTTWHRKHEHRRGAHRGGRARVDRRNRILWRRQSHMRARRGWHSLVLGRGLVRKHRRWIHRNSALTRAGSRRSRITSGRLAPHLRADVRRWAAVLGQQSARSARRRVDRASVLTHSCGSADRLNRTHGRAAASALSGRHERGASRRASAGTQRGRDVGELGARGLGGVALRGADDRHPPVAPRAAQDARAGGTSC
jgi:hypothetical protein